MSLILQYAVSGAIVAGLNTLISISVNNKLVVENHFDFRNVFESTLHSKCKNEIIDKTKKFLPEI